MASPTDPTTAPSERPRARDDIVFRRVGEDWVLFDPATQRIHVLNLTAALVWSFCNGTYAVNEIEAEVREAFGSSVEDAGVEGAVREFRESGLLVEAS